MRNLSYLPTVLVLLIVGCSPVTNDIYIKALDSEVSIEPKNGPIYNSIEEGLDQIILIREKGFHDDLTVHLLPGKHRLRAPITISPKLGPLKIKGEGAEKTVISGSEKLRAKWKEYDDNIWVAQLDKAVSFDQLFIEGEPQILARYPNYDENGGHWQGHASDAIAPERVKTWKNPVGAFVHAMHSGEWGGFHYKVSGVDESGELILQGGTQNNRPSKMHETYRMVENVFEELDGPGEWFLSTEGKLYYWPLPGIDLNTALIETVRKKHLLNIIGTEDSPVSGVSIEGIRFEHTKRTLFEEYEPLLRSDWTIYRGGALFIEGVENVSVTHCEFVNLGGNAIFVSNYNRNVQIMNNHIHDCAGSGICFVGSPDAVRSPSFQYDEFVPLAQIDTVKGPKNNTYPAKSLVDNNLIHRTGRLEKQTAGVEIAMAMDITVSNNSIYDVPRAGINIGDGTWGGHILEYNDVFNTVLESGDHGAFNSWGRDRFWHPNRKTLNEIVAQNPEMPKWDAINTTVIRNNRFRCDHGWDIDLDDGSSNYHIYNNVCLNGGLKLREGFYRTVENNIMLNNGFHPHVWFKNSGDIFRHNIVLAEHKDIRLQDWGQEVDYNLFPDEKALENAQNKGVDAHSIAGNPLFENAALGNFTVKEGSPAFEIGFKNFPMDVFGVKDPELKNLTKTPAIPSLFFGSSADENTIHDWLGAKIKNITTMAERSASGLAKTAGVVFVSLDENGILSKSGIQVGDVIIESEGDTVDSVEDLMKSFQSHNWKGKINVQIFRNQKGQTITLKTK